LESNTTATGNTAVGSSSLEDVTTGHSNSGLGFAALASLTTGIDNVAIGRDALYTSTTGQYNTAVGRSALTLATSGSNNTAVGENCMRTLTTGGDNTAAGVGAIRNSTTGSNNTGIGRAAAGGLTTGSNNTCLGHDAGVSGSPFNLTTSSNRVIIGDSNVTNAYIQVDWTITSDKRDKIDFGTVPHGLDFVNKLEPVSYYMRKDRDSNKRHGQQHYGFIAQDIVALEGDNPVIIDTEEEYRLKYKGEHLVPVLVNAIKELSVKVTALEAG